MLRKPGAVGGDWRGVLYPARMPSFHRLPPPETVAAWVRWFWIPEWHLAPGRVSRQEIIAFPSCNLAVESNRVGLAGPTTRRSFRDLTGRGWAVRTLQRLARQYVGLPPAAMIRRRRLQEAAERLRHEPGIDIAAEANDLGYADHAHLTTDFRNVLNFTPSAYRRTADRPRRREQGDRGTP